MKELTSEETLEVLGACLDLLARRESEIRELYDRLQAYEPDTAAEGRIIGAITPDVDEAGRSASSGWPTAIAVCGTPLVGRTLMLTCPQVGLRITGITDSGLDGLKLAEKNTPDFAFIDLDIDDIDGLVLVSRLKEILPDMTIIALTSTSQENALVSAIIAGANEVIGKPLQTKRLINAVGRLVKSRGKKKEYGRTIPLQFNPAETSESYESWSIL